jgi:Carboxypeptidase regulatory-like domain
MSCKNSSTNAKKGGSMKRIRIGVFVGLLGLVVNSANAWGQASAQISGTVRDQSGAVLPGVEVSATQTDTGIVRSTVTNETGYYVLPTLAVGPYLSE